MKLLTRYLLSLVLILSSAGISAAILTDQPTLAVPAADDIMHVVDISDTTSNPAGTSKQATIANITAPFLANTTVLVNVLTDLPAPSAGVISLAANTNYVLGDNVSLGTNRLNVDAGGISWTSGNQFGPTLTYTGTGTMFTGVDVTFHIFEAQVDAPNGTVFDGSDVASPGTNIWLISAVRISNSAKVGNFTSLNAVVFENSLAANTTQGVTLSGSGWFLFSFVKFAQISTSASFIGVDLGTAVSSSGEIANLLVVAPAGAIGVKGAANSANLVVGGLATFRDGNFLGGLTTEISGISPDDIRWAFDLNSGIQDTMPDAMVSLNANATETIIAVSGTPVKIAGTWVVERSSQFTADTTGRITYNGERPLTTPVDIVTTINSASGTNKDIRVCLALNAVVITNSCKTNLVGQNDPKSNTVLWQLTLNENDFLEVFIANDSDTINLIASDAVQRSR